MNETETNNQELKKIDITAYLRDFWHSFRRLWALVLALTIAAALLSYFRVRRNYSPRYVAEATVSVELMNGGNYANRNTAEQMGLVFPYILTSGALSDVIASDLNTKSVPGTINATCIKGTNLLTITVSAYNPDVANRVLQSVLDNYPEVAQYVVGQTKLKVIDRTEVPKDTGRTSVVRGSIKKGAAIGLIAGLAIVFIRSMTVRTIRSEGELRSLVNVPYLGTLPICRKKKRSTDTRSQINILFDSDRDEYIEAMRLVRTRLDRQMEGKKVLMVTSSVAGEGKSTVAANLATSMALKGKKVILVDCDLRNPSVGKIFNVTESCPGPAAVIEGKSTINEALIEVTKNDVSTGLYLMPGSSKTSRSVEILSSDGMGKLIDELRRHADMVILDTPPSAVLVDAMMLINHVDGIAYVIMSDFARRRYIMNGIEELSSGGAPVAGCILNGGRASSGKYGYYSRYGYYGRYSRYGYYGGYGETSKEEKDND